MVDMDKSGDAWLEDKEMHFILYRTPAYEQVPGGVLAGRATVYRSMFLQETKVITWLIFSMSSDASLPEK